MIDTIAELLEALVESEKAQLAKFGEVRHGPMIGDMYEGLTRDVLSRAVFRGLDLRVVDGKIRNSEGAQSGQIDCMLVEGEGPTLPHTSHYVYPLDRVLAVFEVSKTLFGTKLEDAHSHLRDVFRLMEEENAAHPRLFSHAWRMLVRRPVPSEPRDDLPFRDLQIYNTLALEAAMPLRVVWGYYGFADEVALREAFIRLMEGAIAKAEGPAEGFSPGSLPSLVMCREATLVKLNGMPYGAPIESEWWPCYGSVGTQPLKVLLELVWTRLSYRYQLGVAMFGEDLEEEAVAPLLWARPYEDGKVKGWTYTCQDDHANVLSHRPPSYSWEPVVVSLPEFLVVSKLCAEGRLRMDDPDAAEAMAAHGTTLEAVLARLGAEGLVCEQGGEMLLLTDLCRCGILPDGRFVVGEDRSGRLTRWCLRFVDEWRRLTDPGMGGPASLGEGAG